MVGAARADAAGANMTSAQPTTTRVGSSRPIGRHSNETPTVKPPPLDRDDQINASDPPVDGTTARAACPGVAMLTMRPAPVGKALAGAATLMLRGDEV